MIDACKIHLREQLLARFINTFCHNYEIYFMIEELAKISIKIITLSKTIQIFRKFCSYIFLSSRESVQINLKILNTSKYFSRAYLQIKLHVVQQSCQCNRWQIVTCLTAWEKHFTAGYLVSHFQHLRSHGYGLFFIWPGTHTGFKGLRRSTLFWTGYRLKIIQVMALEQQQLQRFSQIFSTGGQQSQRTKHDKNAIQ